MNGLFRAAVCLAALAGLPALGVAQTPDRGELRGHKHTLTCLAYSPDGLTLASCMRRPLGPIDARTDAPEENNE